MKLLFSAVQCLCLSYIDSAIQLLGSVVAHWWSTIASEARVGFSQPTLATLCLELADKLPFVVRTPAPHYEMTETLLTVTLINNTT